MIDSCVCVCLKKRAGSPIFWLNSVVKLMWFSLFQRRPVGKGKGRKGRKEACAEWKRVHFGHGRRDDLIFGLGLWIDGRVLRVRDVF